MKNDNDIVKRLVECRTDYDDSVIPDRAEPIGCDCGLLREAGEEIERLRVELDSVERWFVAGRDAGSVEDQRIECPHDAESKAEHWWNRGYSYTSRLFRGYAAERERDALRARIADAPIYMIPPHKPDTPDEWFVVVESVKNLNRLRGKRVALVVVDE